MDTLPYFVVCTIALLENKFESIKYYIFKFYLFQDIKLFVFILRNPEGVFNKPKIFYHKVVEKK